MKFFVPLVITLLFHCALSAQPAKEKQLLIIPCQSGDLYIDGVQIAAVDANDASRQTLSYGEHYLQLKSTTGKKNLMLIVNDTLKSIVRLGCEESSETMSGVRLINKTLILAGLLSSETEQNILALDKNDELVINSSIIEKKGTATLLITDNRGREIYHKEDFSSLENERVSIPGKGVYKFTLYTDALFGKTAKLTIDRIPSATSSASFNTTPKLVYDTTYTEILQTLSRVYSATNPSHANRTAISINLPSNTSYWTYWIGVDQQAQGAMKTFIQDLSPALKAISPNPLVLFGLKLIPSLPMLNAPATINYKFMNTANSQNYIAGKACMFYKFKHADNVCTDYAWVNVTGNDMVLSMENLSMADGHNVEVRVVAFMVKSRLLTE